MVRKSWAASRSLRKASSRSPRSDRRWRKAGLESSVMQAGALCRHLTHLFHGNCPAFFDRKHGGFSKCQCDHTVIAIGDRRGIVFDHRDKCGNLVGISFGIARHEKIMQRRAGVACAIGNFDGHWPLVFSADNAGRAMHFNTLIIAISGAA